MRFSDIPGHDEVKQRLRQMVDSDRIPHALMLHGPTGIGKFALARAMAQYIHCENRTPNGDSCGRCPACQQHQTFNHIDTVFTFPVVKKGTGDDSGTSDTYIEEFKQQLDESPFMDYEKWLIKLDNINAQPQIYVNEANELIRKLSYTTHNAKYKVVLMWLPEKLREDAANKLLKLIEEPHSDTIFIMTSDNPRQILPTIFSRVQRVEVRRYDDATISQYLSERMLVDNNAAIKLARLADGSMSQAISLTGLSNNSDEYLDLFIELMRKAYTRKVADLKKWASDVAALGRERSMQFYEYCSHMIRENFMLNIQVPALNLLTDPEAKFSRNFSPFINERNVERLMTVVDNARRDIAANGNGKLINFDVAIKVILLLKQ